MLFISFQLKILLDQVDEAVGDFDECILLRPDSALAQAQKCFALVSNRECECKVCLVNQLHLSTTENQQVSLFCSSPVQTSLYRKQPGTSTDGHGRL